MIIGFFLCKLRWDATVVWSHDDADQDKAFIADEWIFEWMDKRMQGGGSP